MTVQPEQSVTRVEMVTLTIDDHEITPPAIHSSPATRSRAPSSVTEVA